MRTASLILAMLLLIGCRSNGSAPTTKPAMIATLARSGGLIPMAVECRIYSDGVWQGEFDRKNDRKRIGTLSSTSLRRLTVALSATIVAEENYPMPRGSADAYSYTLRTEGRVIRWSEANPDVPESLRRVAELVSSEMIAESAGSQPSRAAPEDR